MKFVFACWPDEEYQPEVLTAMGADHRLVSYHRIVEPVWHIMDEPGFIEHFVTTGLRPEINRRKRKKGWTNPAYKRRRRRAIAAQKPHEGE